MRCSPLIPLFQGVDSCFRVWTLVSGCGFCVRVSSFVSGCGLLFLGVDSCLRVWSLCVRVSSFVSGCGLLFLGVHSVSGYLCVRASCFRVWTPLVSDGWRATWRRGISAGSKSGSGTWGGRRPAPPSTRSSTTNCTARRRACSPPGECSTAGAGRGCWVVGVESWRAEWLGVRWGKVVGQVRVGCC